MAHVVGKLGETAADLGPYAGRAEALTRRYVLSGSLSVDVGGAQEELAADDYLWIEFGVPHAVSGTGAWLEVSAPLPEASLEDTVFTDGPGATPETPYRRGRFDVADLPEPSGAILAGAGANVGGASVKLLINADSGASQFVLMALRYVEGGLIKEHDHAFEEGFFFIEGEIEAPFPDPAQPATQFKG